MPADDGCSKLSVDGGGRNQLLRHMLSSFFITYGAVNGKRTWDIQKRCMTKPTSALDCVCIVILWSAVACTGTDSILSISKYIIKFTKRERFETSVIVNVICLYLLALRRATYIRKFRKDEMTSCRIFFFISSGSILGPSPSNLSILNAISGDFTLKKAYRDLRLQKHGRSGEKK